MLCGDVACAALGPTELGIVFRSGDQGSEAIAREYQRARGVPSANVVAVTVAREPVISPSALAALRASAWRGLPARVRAVLLVWTQPYAVGCMSITTAVAAGYRPEFCEPGCARTAASPFYDAETLDAATREEWRLAMLFPADTPQFARELLERGLAADGTFPRGTVYLVDTADAARNVRSAEFPAVVSAFGQRLLIRRIRDSETTPLGYVLGYFTGVARVTHLGELGFRPGAVADHLTSTGGVLVGADQTTALEWLRAGATASYGTVSEPCNNPGKFPSPGVFLSHYLRGDTLIEAYWKSVAMPGQGLFVGEPLARPFAAASHPRAGTRPTVPPPARP